MPCHTDFDIFPVVSTDGQDAARKMRLKMKMEAQGMAGADEFNIV